MGSPKEARNDVPDAGTHGTSAWAPEAAPRVLFLVFLSRFRLFFRLKTPRNLKWIFFSHCIVFNNLLRTFDLQLFILWFVDLHDSSQQNTQNTYGVAWSRIKLNYNDSGENNTICSQTIENSSNSHLICL
jgi:hypothetical protein